MKKDTPHMEKIAQQLKQAGMTRYGFLKMETAALPSIIHEDENIGGVVYGRRDKDKLSSAMLVATDRRIIFIDSKTMFTESDEVSYHVVSGVKMDTSGPFASVTLHTRVTDYMLRFVNLHCAKTFVNYIEEFIETGERVPVQDVILPPTQASAAPEKSSVESAEQLGFMDDTGILCTVDRDGKPHGSVIHFITDAEDAFYFLTKQDTRKVANISGNPYVCLVIHNSHSLKVLTVHGNASKISDQETFTYVFDHIAIARTYQEGVKFAPITKIDSGKYVAYKITPTDSKLDDFGKTSW